MPATTPSRTLPIVWQRLVDAGGKTCDRCTGTRNELQHAVEKLSAMLRPLSITPTLEEKEIDAGLFAADPSQSNRIWIGGRPIEEWLGASASTSPCCSVCGDAECRTLEVEGATFETIPEALILKAALAAAGALIAPETPGSECQCAPRCCPD